MTWLTIIMLFIYTLASVFLIFVILIQAGDKGGGLSSLGASSQGLSDALGATGAEKTMNNVTTIAAILFIVLAIGLSLAVGSHNPDQILPDASTVAPPLSDTAPPAPGLPGAMGEEMFPGEAGMMQPGESIPITLTPETVPAEGGAAAPAEAPADAVPAPEAAAPSAPPAGQ